MRHDDGPDDSASNTAAVVAAAAAAGFVNAATMASTAGNKLADVGESEIEAARQQQAHVANTDESSAADDQNVKQRRFSAIGIAFFIITYLLGVIGFLCVLAAHPFVLLLDRSRRRFHQIIGLSWLRFSLASVRIMPELINSHNLPPRDKTVVFVANHVSYMDIYVLPYLNRMLKVVAKAEIFSMPIVGWAMQMAGNIGVKRSDRRGQLEAFHEMVAVLQRDISLVVYPEGTRSRSGRLSRFKLGAFRAAKTANVSIVPVTITGTREMMPSHAFVPLCYPKKPIQLTVHPAIDSFGRSVEELRDLAFSAINSTLEPAMQSTILSHGTQSPQSVHASPPSAASTPFPTTSQTSSSSPATQESSSLFPPSS
jgi:1-acyl-sn-glycerol-3-phosphate acyltransferase